MKIYKLVQRLLAENKTYSVQTAQTRAVNIKHIIGLAEDTFVKKESVDKIVNDAATRVKTLISDGKKKGEIKFLFRADNFECGGFPSYYTYEKGGNRLYKAHVCIRNLTVENRNKGVGTKLVKEAVKASLKEQIDGRVFVNAICTDEKSSPCVFYYKLGFRCVTPEKNEIVQKTIENNEILPKEFEDFMYLPKENIIHLLRK